MHGLKRNQLSMLSRSDIASTLGRWLAALVAAVTLCGAHGEELSKLIGNHTRLPLDLNRNVLEDPQLYYEYELVQQGGNDSGPDDNESERPAGLLVGRRGRQMSGKQLTGCPTKPSYDHARSRYASIHYYIPESKRTIRIDESKVGWHRADIEQLLSKGLDVDKPSLAIMGGWTQNSGERWIAKLKENYDELYAAGGSRGAPFNLLIYDWSNYGFGLYPTAASNVDMAGAALANFFERLIDEHKYNTSQIQFLSYSLSAHISGLAGRRLRKKYGSPITMITTVDPTGVCFHDDSKFGKTFGIKPNDAKLVVARHYNMQGLGAKRPIGGLDILVNDGMSQPTMSVNGWWTESVAGASGVGLFSHLRAVRHEVDRFDPTSDCHEVAYECSSHEAFMAGECGHCKRNNGSCFMINTLGNLRMGQRPEGMNFKPRTEMFISTGREQFCVHHYQVVARLHENATRETIDSFKRGDFYFLLGDEEVRPRHLVSGRQGRKIVFTQLMRPDDLLPSLPGRVPLKRTSRALLDEVKMVAIRYLSHLLPETRRKRSANYCPDWNASQPVLVRCSSGRATR